MATLILWHHHTRHIVYSQTHCCKSVYTYTVRYMTIPTLYYSIVTDEDLRGWNVLHYHLFQLLRDCSTIAPPLPTWHASILLINALCHALCCCSHSLTLQPATHYLQASFNSTIYSYRCKFISPLSLYSYSQLHPCSYVVHVMWLHVQQSVCTPYSMQEADETYSA